MMRLPVEPVPAAGEAWTGIFGGFGALQHEGLSLSEPLREDGDAELGDVVEDRSAESPFEVAATALLQADVKLEMPPFAVWCRAWPAAPSCRSRRPP